MSEDHEASPMLKEKGCQEVIKMAANFQNSGRNAQQTKVIVLQQNNSGNISLTQSVAEQSQIGNNHFHDRQSKRNQVLEQFFCESNHKAELTAVQEDRIRENFRK